MRKVNRTDGNQCKEFLMDVTDAWSLYNITERTLTLNNGGVQSNVGGVANLCFINDYIWSFLVCTQLSYRIFAWFDGSGRNIMNLTDLVLKCDWLSWIMLIWDCVDLFDLFIFVLALFHSAKFSNDPDERCRCCVDGVWNRTKSSYMGLFLSNLKLSHFCYAWFHLAKWLYPSTHLKKL